jgi:F-type H+-transporting ATPase subunit epsilon
MADTFQIEVATPERLLVNERATEAQIPGAEGYLGVLPGHAALVSQLKSGVLSYKTKDRKITLAVHGGFVEIRDDHVRVLADSAEPVTEIDIKRAEEALRRAQARLVNPALGIDIARALSASMRAQARIDAARREVEK